ncbi:hypothetical protein [Paractinoplanes toevensis]|uniref:Uncharacterized protein n=1 Tax=Paractinoplanes toevensis TaxID=571911 RepID=A0A919W3K6_9ACTN|nr:hypothetical protein [Actinoplanes toevensis]GIM90635.1 hypothetical protein Ato02nite_024280 [Actinoplanes toevensis]
MNRTLVAESPATSHPPTRETLDDLGDRRAGPVAMLDPGLSIGDTRYPYRVQCEQSKLTPLLRDYEGMRTADPVQARSSPPRTSMIASRYVVDS